MFCTFIATLGLVFCSNQVNQTELFAPPPIVEAVAAAGSLIVIEPSPPHIFPVPTTVPAEPLPSTAFAAWRR